MCTVVVSFFFYFFFFNDTATTEIYTLSLPRRSSDLWSGAECERRRFPRPPSWQSRRHPSALLRQSFLRCRRCRKRGFFRYSGSWQKNRDIDLKPRDERKRV